MSVLNQLNPSMPDTLAGNIQNPFSAKVRSGGERPNDFPGGFVITEYVNGVAQDGRNKSPKSQIILNGNMMPMQPFPWTGEQRLNKEYYPGNPQPAVHVLGGKEGEVVIRGRFKEKKYRSPNIPYGISYQFAQALDEMRKRGNLLKFGMGGASGNFFRYGFLEKSDFKMNKLSWIDYELTFFVVSDTLPVNNNFTAPEKNAPDSANANLLQAANDFQATYSAVPATMPRSIADEMNGLISDVATKVNLVTNFVGLVISTVADVVASANRALGLIKNARAQLSIFKRQVGGIAQNFANLSTALDAASQTRQAFSNVSYLTNVSTATSTMSAMLAQMQAQFEKISQTLPKARYKVQQNDTLQNISIKFYGTADQWSLIYDHNHLTSTVLVSGTVLEIPRL